MLRYIIIFFVYCCGYSAALCHTPKWEYVTTYAKPDEAMGSEKIEVYVKDGYIYIAAPKQMNVKLFSLLGQLVTQQNLPAGVSRIKIPAHGIYILKAGDLTIRVTA